MEYEDSYGEKPKSEMYIDPKEREFILGILIRAEEITAQKVLHKKDIDEIKTIISGLNDVLSQIFLQNEIDSENTFSDQTKQEWMDNELRIKNIIDAIQRFLGQYGKNSDATRALDKELDLLNEKLKKI